MSSTSTQTLDVSKESELNVPCYENDSHAAVVFCEDCAVNFCRECSDGFHAWKANAEHEIVRLTKTEKLEGPKPIKCHLHPKNEAHLICKEPNCEGTNKPICIWCHQYDGHKDHKYELLKNECTKVQTNIKDCLKEIETKTITCDKLLDEYDRCIDSYSDKNEFMKAQRNKIEKIYSDAKTMALKTLDDFAENRVELLKLLKNQYDNDRDKLDDMKTLVRGFEKMGMADMLENGENVEVLTKKVEKTVPEPTDVVPSKCYDLTYPSSDLLNIKVDINHAAIAQLKKPQKNIAVYYLNSNLSPYKPLPHRYFGTDNVIEQENGWLFTYTSGHQILSLKERPTNDTVDSSKYIYIAVMELSTKDGKQGENLMRKELKNKWCHTFIVKTDNINWTLQGKFLMAFCNMSKADRRVRVIGHSYNRPLDGWFFKFASIKRN